MADNITENQEQQITQSTPESSPEKFQRARQFVDTGIDLIRDNKYTEASKHFRNTDFAQSIDVYLDPAVYIVPPPYNENDPKEVRYTANILASHSHYNKGLITFSVIDARIKNPNGGYIPIPEVLQQEQALLHTEEWLHVLQDLHGKPLTNETNDEIDVAAYLMAHNVPLTDTFLDRYGRREALKPETIKTQAKQL